MTPTVQPHLKLDAAPQRQASDGARGRRRMSPSRTVRRVIGVLALLLAGSAAGGGEAGNRELAPLDAEILELEQTLAQKRSARAAVELAREEDALAGAARGRALQQDREMPEGGRCRPGGSPPCESGLTCVASASDPSTGVCGSAAPPSPPSPGRRPSPPPPPGPTGPESEDDTHDGGHVTDVWQTQRCVPKLCESGASPPFVRKVRELKNARCRCSQSWGESARAQLVCRTSQPVFFQ